MSEAILQTKLNAPALRHNRVDRPHLLQRLNAGLRDRCHLVLVSSAAGFGKTTALGDWATQARIDVAWVTLDEKENDPVRFCSYLIAALQQVFPGIGEQLLNLFQSPQPPSLEAVLTLLINEISAVPTPIALVLDDYHVITTGAIHEGMRFLIDHAPRHLHLIIATRADPPFNLSRLRARGQLLEMRANDLRFSADECALFLNQVMGLDLSSGQITELETRTEGWITGLQMAALAMKGKEDVDGFVKEFSGSNRFILDYLIEEVLSQQSPEIQFFLLETSLLERVCGPLCDYLLNPQDRVDMPEAVGKMSVRTTDAQAILEMLEQTNLFLIPLDEQRQWFRYHHLFAEVMAARMRRFHPEQLSELHLRATHWFEQHDLLAEAIAHALKAQAYEQAATLLRKMAMDMLKNGELTSLMHWLERFPKEIVAAYPWLNVAYAWANLLSGRTESVEIYLVAAERCLVEGEDHNELRGHIAAIRTYSTGMYGDATRAIDLASEALALLPEHDFTVRCVVTFVLGGVYAMRGNFAQAIETLQEAGQTGQRAGNRFLTVSAWSAAADLLRRQCKLTESELVFQQALAAGTTSGKPSPMMITTYIGLARVHLTRGDLEQARHWEALAMEQSKLLMNTEVSVQCHLLLAEIEYQDGNMLAARTAWEHTRHLAASHELGSFLRGDLANFEALIQSPSSSHHTHRPGIEPLSERELEVLGLLAEAMSNQEIAEHLYISVGTVKAHSSNIYRKLNVRNRTQAIAFARELRLL